jgi:very-short-patch-repair endonuclease
MVSLMDEAVEKAIARLARRQRGNVTNAQLRALGLGAGAIQHRIRIGWLIQMYRGVYAVGRLPVAPEDSAAAAVLACGPQAVLSHRSALCLWRWSRPLVPPFHVTTPSRHRRPEILLHRSTRLTRADTRLHLGIRVTSPARTLLDCAPALTDKQLARAAREARLSPYLRTSEIADVVARFPRHPGAKRLSVLAALAPTRSEFEDVFPSFCRTYDLPEPKMNTLVNGYEADAVFEAEKLIVELDGYQFHGDRQSFERDRERDAHQLAAGYGTVRITWQRLADDPQREADRLNTILVSRRA